MKIKTIEYKTNNFGEIDRTKPAKIIYEEIGLENFSELLYFIRLIHAKYRVHVRYENNTEYISVVGDDFRKHITII